MSITQSASNVLTKLGEAITFTYETGEVRDPATGEVITPASTTEVTGFGYPGGYRSMDIDGEVIQRGDVRLTAEKVSTRPQVGWRCTVDSREYRVMDVRKVRFSGDDVVYICRLRV